MPPEPHRGALRERSDGVWRRPSEESADIYPGLVVCDDRVTGSITIGPTRLPMWAVLPDVIRAGWSEAVADYGADMSAPDAADFLHFLTQQRGEFGRLVLELAAAERAETFSSRRTAWWQTKKRRRLLRAQLVRCIEAIDREEANHGR